MRIFKSLVRHKQKTIHDNSHEIDEKKCHDNSQNQQNDKDKCVTIF